MPKYQFEAPDNLWKKWKRTVPRDQTLEERILELLEADAEGRVRDDQEAESVAESDPSGAPPQESQEAQPPDEGDESNASKGAKPSNRLPEVEFPTSRERHECVDAVLAVREYLREHGPASMREIVREVMPTYPIGYDVDDALAKIEAGERYRGAWWRHVVKPGLEALPDVEAPPQSGSNWRWSPSN